MGSRTKTVTGASFQTLYDDEGKENSLLMGVMASSNARDNIRGYGNFDDTFTKISTYFNSRAVHSVLTGGTGSIFSAIDAMSSGIHSVGHSIDSTESVGTTVENLIYEDYTDTIPSTVTIDTIAISGSIINYTLSDGTTGSTPLTSAPLMRINYTFSGVSYFRIVYEDNYSTDDDGDLDFYASAVKIQGEELSRRVVYPILNRFGTIRRSLDEGMDEPELKDIYFTYCAKIDSDIAKDLFSIMDEHGVTSYRIPVYNSTYHAVVYRNSGMKYRGTTVKDDDGDKVVMIPMELFRELNVYNKYVQLKKTVGIMTFSTKEIKLKWYQTELFKWIFFIITIVVAVITQQYYIIGWTIGLKALSIIFKDNKWAMVIISVIGAVYGVYTVGFTTASVLSLASSLSSVYVKYQFDNTMEDIAELSEREKELREASKGISKTYTFDSSSARLIDVSDLIYESYDLAYNEVEYVYASMDSVYDIYN